jgi:hypothetical protein
MAENDSWQYIDPDVLQRNSGLVEHKVRTGESLKSLSERLGCRWQDLALLNWGTDQPKQINWYLQHHVGCRRNANGHFVFSDSDAPGIILLPHPLERTTHRLVRGSVRVSRYPL